jgi:methionine-rich copper-binding protein CopC
MRDFVRSVVPVSAARWLLGTGLIVLCPAFLFAHATLLRTEPAVDTHISQLPGEIRFWFSESIERRFSRITVHRATRDTVAGEIQPQERVDTGLAAGSQVTQELAVQLPATLPPGLYLVQWKVLSIDSHRTTGRFTLTYEPQAATTPETEKAKSTP